MPRPYGWVVVGGHSGLLGEVIGVVAMLDWSYRWWMLARCEERKFEVVDL